MLNIYQKKKQEDFQLILTIMHSKIMSICFVFKSIGFALRGFRKKQLYYNLLLVVTPDFHLKIINFNTNIILYSLLSSFTYLKGRLCVLPLQKKLFA